MQASVPLPPVSELFERYGALVYRRCRSILGESDAPDAVQEVFIRLVENGQAFRGECSPSTWLYRLATLYCLQRLRNHNRRTAKLQLLQKDATERSTPRLDEHLSLMRLIHDESEETRLMVYLRYIDGLNLEEVAQVVGRSRKTVAQRLSEFVDAARVELDLETDS